MLGLDESGSSGQLNECDQLIPPGSAEEQSEITYSLIDATRSVAYAIFGLWFVAGYPAVPMPVVTR